MKFSLNMVIQMFAIALQAGNAALDFVPPNKKPVIASVIGVGQAVVGLLAHYVNPDGTNAKAPYVAPI